MPSSAIDPAGLDLLNPDVVTPDELASFQAFYTAMKGSQNRSYEFWLEFRPDVIKRHKARTVQWYVGAQDAVQALACVHQYTITAFRDGIDYQMHLAQSTGARRSDIVDVLSVAFIHAGHQGMYAAASMADYLRGYQDPRTPDRFPAGWRFDPAVFESGMDQSDLHASAEDLGRLREWYRGTLGEVPRHVEFMANYRPDLLKAYRVRYEHAIRQSLPCQMLPYLLLNHAVYRGRRSAVRENLLLARALGLTRRQVLNSIFSAVLYSAANALDVFDDELDEIIASLPADTTG